MGKETQFRPGQSGNPRGRPKENQAANSALVPCGKPRPAKDRKKSDLLVILKPRPRKYVEGILSGKTKKAAALAAGYSESAARNAAAVIERPLVRRALQEIIREAIPAEKIVQRLVEGLDAMDTIIVRCKGKITDERTVIAWATRLRYIELAAKMAGYYVEGQYLPLDDLRNDIDTGSNWPEEEEN